jgi:lysine 6-dehydrogenase
MEYKTLRYPGHAAIMRPIRDLGLIADRPVEVRGKSVVPRDVFIAVVEPRLRKPASPDLVALRVIVSGERKGEPAGEGFELLDHFDAATGISAMMRTTGYSLALTALLQADGTIAEPGVRTPDEAVPYDPYVQGLRAQGVRVTGHQLPVTSDQ